jgi:hypothetical protein
MSNSGFRPPHRSAAFCMRHREADFRSVLLPERFGLLPCTFGTLKGILQSSSASGLPLLNSESIAGIELCAYHITQPPALQEQTALSPVFPQYFRFLLFFLSTFGNYATIFSFSAA